MNYIEFSQNIKKKYPQYQDMNDIDLAKKMVSKYPQYSDVSFDDYSVGGFIKNIGSEISRIPGAVVDTAKGAWDLMNLPPAQLGQVAKEFSPVLPDKESPIGIRPGGVYSGIVKEYSNPLQRAYEKPLSTAFDVGTIAYPALKGTKAGSILGDIGKSTISPIKPILDVPGKLISGATKKIASGVFGPTEEAISARIARPAEIANAAAYEDLAGDLSKTVNSLKNKIEVADDNAWNSLLKLKSEPRSEILNILKDVRNGIRVTGGRAVGLADNRAIATIDGIISDIKNIKQKGIPSVLEQMLDQRQMREILQAVRRNINWEDPMASRTNQALMEFQSKLSEKLKFNNPEYSKIMDPLAEKTKLLDEISNSFSLKNEGGKLVPSDTTAGKFNQILDEKRLKTRGLLERFKKETGVDFLKKAEDYRFGKQFESGATRAQGSKRVNLGGAIGTSVGGLIGGFPGAGVGGITGVLAGSVLDKQGGAILANIIDGFIATKKNIPNLTISEYLPISIKSAFEGKRINDEIGKKILDASGGDPNEARRISKQIGLRNEDGRPF